MSFVIAGAVIGMEYNGTGVVSACQQVLTARSSEGEPATGLSFSSASPSEGAQQVENFFNYADMQMNA